MPEKYSIRHAQEKDIAGISRILAPYARERLLLPRSREDLRTHIGNFSVAVSEGRVVGCCALRNYGKGLFEIRSLAVSEDFSNAGIGTALVRSCIERAASSGKARIFALTYRARLFERLGFSRVPKSLFPEKIWSDCAFCPKKDNCDEEALQIEIG